MFLKRNQGFGQTYRKKKKGTNNKNQTSKDLCTDINDGLREIKDGGCTANFTSAVPYFSGNLVKLGLGWTQGDQRVSENQTKNPPILSHKYSTYSSIRLEWIHSSKRMYVSRSSSYRLGVFAVWWSTWISKEKQRTFRQLQHRRKETLIQTHSERSLVIRMDDSWWDAIFGHNEGKVKQSLK